MTRFELVTYGLRNRHPLFLVDAEERVLFEVSDYSLLMTQKD